MVGPDFRNFRYNVLVAKDGSLWLWNGGTNGVAVTKDTKFLGFGSGGLRGVTEAATAKDGGQIVLPVVLAQDTDTMFVTLPGSDTEQAMPLHRVTATLTLKGYPDTGVPLHSVSRKPNPTIREECSVLCVVIAVDVNRINNLL